MGIVKSLKKFHEKDLQHTEMAKGNVPAYCLDCKRQITPKGMNSWGLIALIILGLVLTPFLIGLFLLFVAVVYYTKHYKGAGRCPICNGKNLKYVSRDSV